MLLAAMLKIPWVVVKIEMLDRLNANELFTPSWTGPGSNQILTSQNSQYTLISQANGSLTIWFGPPVPTGGNPVWSSNSNGTASRAVMKDRDFMVYETSSTTLWSSDTPGHPGAYVVIENNGLLIVHDPDDLLLWASDNWDSSLLGTQQVAPQTRD